MDAPFDSANRLGDRLEALTQLRNRCRVAIRTGENGPHKKALGRTVIEDRKLADLGAMLFKKGDHGSHLAARAVARQGKSILAGRHQHPTTLTAGPPRDVSLYLTFMSAPVSHIFLIIWPRLS
jgi:hypothetical protein